MSMFEQLKKQVPVNSKIFWHLIRKILIWTFWDYKSSWSKKSTPIQPQGVIGAPLLCIFKRCNSRECSVHFFRGLWLNLLWDFKWMGFHHGLINSDEHIININDFHFSMIRDLCMSGSCHLDRVSNDEFSVECLFWFSWHEKQIWE